MYRKLADDLHYDDRGTITEFVKMILFFVLDTIKEFSHKPKTQIFHFDQFAKKSNYIHITVFSPKTNCHCLVLSL